MSKIKTIHSTKIDPNMVNVEKDYLYQKYMTIELDAIDSDFDQNIIDEIVLWKLNRYAKIDNCTIELINQIKKTDKNLDSDLTRKILLKLLHPDLKGIRIAMASTILRFKNPDIYQIIDQRVYRFIHPNGEELKQNDSVENQISTYFDYLKRLHEVCNEHNIEFNHADRILYLMDKTLNKEHKLN